MQLLELPLVLLQDIIRDVVESEHVHAILYLRQVNRYFDCEIMNNIAKLRLQDLELPYWKHGHRWVQDSFVVRLVLAKVRSYSRGFNDFRATLNAVTDFVFYAQIDLNVNIGRDEIMRTACEMAIKTHGVRDISRLISKTDDEGHSGEIIDHIAECAFAIAVAAPYPLLYNQMLQQAGFCPTFESRYFGTPLVIAVQFGRKESVERLLGIESVISEDPPQFLHDAFVQAARVGDVEIMKLFLDPKNQRFLSTKLARAIGLECEEYTRPGLFREAAICAIRGHHEDIALLLLEQRPELGRRERKRVCICAASHGMEGVLRRCLNRDMNNSKILYEAIDQGCCPVSTARLLLERGAFVRSRKYLSGKIYDSFFVAARHSRLDLMALFMGEGVDLKKDYEGYSSFNINTKNPAILQFLLDHGLDFESPASRNSMCWTQKYAVKKRRAGVVRWFLVNLHLQSASEDRETIISHLQQTMELANGEIRRLFVEFGVAPLSSMEDTAQNSHDDVQGSGDGPTLCSDAQ